MTARGVSTGKLIRRRRTSGIDQIRTNRRRIWNKESAAKIISLKISRACTLSERQRSITNSYIIKATIHRPQAYKVRILIGDIEVDPADITVETIDLIGGEVFTVAAVGEFEVDFIGTDIFSGFTDSNIVSVVIVIGDIVVIVYGVSLIASIVSKIIYILISTIRKIIILNSTVITIDNWRVIQGVARRILVKFGILVVNNSVSGSVIGIVGAFRSNSRSIIIDHNKGAVCLMQISSAPCSRLNRIIRRDSGTGTNRILHPVTEKLARLRRRTIADESWKRSANIITDPTDEICKTLHLSRPTVRINQLEMATAHKISNLVKIVHSGTGRICRYLASTLQCKCLIGRHIIRKTRAVEIRPHGVDIISPSLIIRIGRSGRRIRIDSGTKHGETTRHTRRKPLINIFTKRSGRINNEKLSITCSPSIEHIRGRNNSIGIIQDIRNNRPESLPSGRNWRNNKRKSSDNHKEE